MKKRSGLSNQDARALQEEFAGRELEEAAFSGLAAYEGENGRAEEGLERRITVPDREQAKRLARAKKRRNKKLSSLTTFTAEQHRSLKLKPGAKGSSLSTKKDLEDLFEAEITAAPQLEKKDARKGILALFRFGFVPSEAHSGRRKHVSSLAIVFLLLLAFLFLSYTSWKGLFIKPEISQEPNLAESSISALLTEIGMTPTTFPRTSSSSLRSASSSTESSRRETTTEATTAPITHPALVTETTTVTPTSTVATTSTVTTTPPVTTPTTPSTVATSSIEETTSTEASTTESTTASSETSNTTGSEATSATESSSISSNSSESGSTHSSESTSSVSPTDSP